MPFIQEEALRTRVEHVAALGNRYPGTPGEARCRDFLLDEFGRVGLANVRAEELPYLAYEPVSAECEVVGDGVKLRCAGLQYSADAVAEGEAVYAGSGSPDEIEAVRQRAGGLEGKVVVVQTFLTMDVAPTLAAEGVAAVVNVGEVPDGLAPHFVATFYPSPVEPPWDSRVLSIPGVTLEAQAARALLSLLSTGPLRVRVTHGARYAEKTTANVVGELPGTETPDERVVVGAHYDTQLEGPGAADNATGVGALLALADAWSSEPLRRTVVLVAFAGEELACCGSYAYVLRHLDEVATTRAMVNLDALGLPFEGVRVLAADAEMAPLAREAVRATGWEPETELDASLFPYADYIPFLDAGVPSCWLWRFPPQHPYYHSAGDVLRHVDFRRVEDVANASAAVAFTLANEPELSLGRARPARQWSTLLAAV